jgi:hypothetical protein
MVDVPKKEREHSQWQFGHSVQMVRPAAAAKASGSPRGAPSATEERSVGKP